MLTDIVLNEWVEKEVTKGEERLMQVRRRLFRNVESNQTAIGEKKEKGIKLEREAQMNSEMNYLVITIKENHKEEFTAK